MLIRCIVHYYRDLISFFITELFLDDEDVEKLHDFEEDCLDDLFRRKVTRDDRNDESGSGFGRVPSNWVEKFNDYIDGTGEMNSLFATQLQSMEERLVMLEEANRRVRGELLSFLPVVNMLPLFSY